MSTATAERSIRITVDKNQLRAYLHAANVRPDLVTPEAITLKLNEAKIPVTPELVERCKAIITDLKAGTLDNEPILLAEGKEPVPGTGAKFEYAEIENAGNENTVDPETIDFYQSRIWTVQQGESIGTWTPEMPPQPGQDVYGHPLPGPKPEVSVSLGENVKLAEDKKTVIATAAGKVHLTRYSVSVVEIVDIPGDVDFSTGNVEAPIDLLINGTVRETFSVRSDKSITVKGTIEAANIQAGTDINVRGGIISDPQYRVEAGGELFTKFCQQVNLSAGGDITVTREIMNCRVHTKCRLLVPRGKVIGGHIYARGGAEISELGNEANVKTHIAVGLDPYAIIKSREIDQIVKKKLEAAAKIREKVQPLMAMLKRLTAEQREKATELMYEADELEMAARDEEARKAELIAAGRPADGIEPAIEINKIIHPGTTITIGDKQSLFHKERKGHFKICRRLINRVEEIVLIDLISGSLTTLQSREFVPEEEEK